MTFHETPNHAAAYVAGVSVEQYEAHEDALVAEAESGWDNIPYWEVSSDADYAGLDAMLAFEAAHPEFPVYPIGYGE